MGGNAFNKILPSTSFPRVPPEIYYALKSRITPILQSIFSYVETPAEAPEKLDYGDLDFTVSSPVLSNIPIQLISADDGEEEATVPHEVICEALGAEHVVPVPGHRTSNYAIPMDPREWEDMGYKGLYEQYEKKACPGKLYYQVDVHSSVDEEEARRIVFFNSYGDLGMIMGLLAANNGLRLSPHGLKMPNGNLKPVLLTQDMTEVMRFLGLDVSIRERLGGFQTRGQIFEWIVGSRFFDRRWFRTKGEGVSKVKEVRVMYWEFLKWVEETRVGGLHEDEMDVLEWEKRKERRREEALIHFGLKEGYDREKREIALRAKIKLVFNSITVRKWTSIDNWKVVGILIAKAKVNMGGPEGVMKVYVEEGEAGIKKEVLKAVAARDW